MKFRINVCKGMGNLWSSSRILTICTGSPFSIDLSSMPAAAGVTSVSEGGRPDEMASSCPSPLVGGRY